MAFLRWRQPIITRITPHNGNRRFMVPNRPSEQRQALWRLVKALWFDQHVGQCSGALWDFNEPGVLWQDAAGTIPAVVTNDPVRRVNDLSGLGNHVTAADAGAILTNTPQGNTLHLTTSAGLVTAGAVAGTAGQQQIFTAFSADLLVNTPAQSLLGIGAGNVAGALSVRAPATAGTATIDARGVDNATAGQIATSGALPTAATYCGWGAQNLSGVGNTTLYLDGVGSYSSVGQVGITVPPAQQIGLLCTGTATAPNRGNPVRCGMVWAGDANIVHGTAAVLALIAWLQSHNP